MAEELKRTADSAGTVVPAKVSERLLAFLIDAFAVILPMGALGVWLGPMEAGSAIGVIYGLSVYAVFLAYHGALNSVCGQTPGKWVAGIKVFRLRDGKGEPLGLGRGFVRAFGYFLSAAPLGLGFLWPLVNDYGRGWHDCLAGTCVVRVREKGPAGRFAVAAGAWLLLAAIVSGAAYRMAARGPMADVEMVTAARQALALLGVLEERHKSAMGRYSESAIEIAEQADTPSDLHQALPRLLLENSLEIRLTPGGYLITARARDSKHTRVEFSGPPPPSKPH